jgi:wobble nucleotide-excising tRNase
VKFSEKEKLGEDMLERIEEIHGIGLLHNTNAKRHAFNKVTLVYADNGRGKSTLAAILRSASTGDASLITARKTIDGILPPKVVLQFGSGHKVSFDGSTWSEQRPEVLVFDADFIERNVHSGGTVNTNHRKNLLEFALGEAAVAARLNVEKATEQSRTAAEKVQNIVSQLSGYHIGLSLTQFEKLPQVADIDFKLVDLQNRINAARNVATILARPIPSVIPEPIFDLDNLFSGLGTSLEDVHADAERIVRSHIEKLENKDAESWLSRGQQFDDRKTCPYCGQRTTDNELIRSYRTHFNAAYADLKARVTAICERATAATSFSIIDAFSQRVATANAQAGVWADHVQIQAIHFDAEAARAALIELQAFVLHLCSKKQASPAESVGRAADRELATELWRKVIAPMQVANMLIKTNIAAVNTYREQLSSDNVAQLQQQIDLLLATKRRYDTKVVGLFGELTTARTDAKDAEKAKKVARDKLDTLMKETLDKYEKSINDLLRKFGASFTIKGMGANYRGAAPRSEYGLLLRGKDVALEGGPPSFRTALSEADKRTLAFAFFVACTLADTKLASRIVVIDDPICSLDLNRKHHTKAVLKKIVAKAEQLIVLAHDPYFIRDLRDALRKDDSTTSITTIQLVLAPEEYSDFDALEIDKECESLYFQHHRLLNDFSAGRGGDAKLIAKAIRPMLEGYLHRRFPGIVPKSLMFGQVIALIRDASPPNPLCHAQGLVDELNEINEYAGQFHHDTNPGADSLAVVAAELKTFVDRALLLVHSGKAP